MCCPCYAKYNAQVTWKYASPELVKLHCGEAEDSSGTVVMAESVDLWALGITLMEVCSGGKSFLSGLNSVVSLQARIAAISQAEIDLYINAQFKHSKGTRKVLLALLKVLHL